MFDIWSKLIKQSGLPGTIKEPTSTGKIAVKLEAKSIISDPPKGFYKVTNMYVDPKTKKVVLDYDDTLQ